MGSKLIRHNVVFILMLFLAACGYHLRGAVEIPEQLKNVYVQGASGALYNALRSAVKSSNGRIVSIPKQAGIIIRILRDEMLPPRVLSLSSGGKANEFELEYRLRYELLDTEGKVLMKQQQVEVNKSYFNEQLEILAKNNEEDVIRKEMYRQAVRTIFSQARAVLTK